MSDGRAEVDQAVLNEVVKRYAHVLNEYHFSCENFDADSARTFISTFRRKEIYNLRNRLCEMLGLRKSLLDIMLVQNVFDRLSSIYYFYKSRDPEDIIKYLSDELEISLNAVVKELIRTFIHCPVGINNWNFINQLRRSWKEPVEIEGIFNRIIPDTATFYREASEHAIRMAVSEAESYSYLSPIIAAYKQKIGNLPLNVFTSAEVGEKIIDAIALLGSAQISQLLKVHPDIYKQTKRRAVKYINDAISNLDSFRVFEYISILNNIVKENGFREDAYVADPVNGPIPSTLDSNKAPQEWSRTCQKYFGDRIAAKVDIYRSNIRTGDVDSKTDSCVYYLSSHFDLKMWKPSNFYGTLMKDEINAWSHTLSSKVVDDENLTQTNGFKELWDFNRKLFPKDDDDKRMKDIVTFCTTLAEEHSAESNHLKRIAFNLRSYSLQKQHFIQSFGNVTDPSQKDSQAGKQKDSKYLWTEPKNWEDNFSAIFVYMLRYIMRDELQGYEIVARIWFLCAADTSEHVQKCAELSLLLKPPIQQETIMDTALTNLVNFLSISNDNVKPAVKSMGSELYAFYKQIGGKKVFSTLF